MIPHFYAFVEERKKVHCLYILFSKLQATPKRIYSTIYAADSIVQSVVESSFITLEELVESSVPHNINEHSEAQNILDLTVWECLVAVDFWLVNIVVMSGGGSGLAIINNFFLASPSQLECHLKTIQFPSFSFVRIFSTSHENDVIMK